MSIDTRNLTGARASSAVRCITKAQHEALGTPRDDEATQWLEKHFRRGVNVGRAWANSAAALIPGAILEAEVRWGPPEYGWVGHVDLLDPTNKRIYEAYHAAGGAFREEKALQAAFYADEFGPEWTAELAVIDTTDVSDEDGFAVQPYEINVDGLRDRVRDIKHRVITAVEAGAWNPADRVSDTPHHSECRSCPFSATCHAGWQPPAPQDIPGLEDKFEALRITESDLHHAEAQAKTVKQRRDLQREAIREFLEPGIPATSGDTTITVTEVKGRTSVKLGDFTKAGHQIPDELAPYVTIGKGHERWDVTKVES
jgi:hypothetical protein